MNTPNDFMIEMGRLFGTGRGGQMVENEQLALQQQHQQMLEQQARQSAIQQWMMSDPKNLPEVQQSILGGQTIRSNDQTYNFNEQAQPLQLEQQRLTNQGMGIQNSAQEFGLNRERAAEMVNGDPFGLTHAKQGADLMAAHDAVKKQKDAQAASAALSIITLGAGGLAGLLGGAGGAAAGGAGEAATSGSASGTGLGGLLSTPGQNGDGVAKQGIPPPPEAMTLETATSPTLPGEGNPFANPTGLSMLQNYLQQKSGIDSAAAQIAAQKQHSQTSAAIEGFQWSDPSSPVHDQFTQRLLELAGLPTTGLQSNTNPLAEAAMRVHGARKPQSSTAGVPQIQPQGNGAFTPNGGAPNPGGLGYVPALQALVGPVGQGVNYMMYGKTGQEPVGPVQGPPVSRGHTWGDTPQFNPQGAPNTFQAYPSPQAPAQVQPSLKQDRPVLPEYLKTPVIHPELLNMIMNGTSPGLEEAIRLKTFLNTR